MYVLPIDIQCQIVLPSAGKVAADPSVPLYMTPLTGGLLTKAFLSSYVLYSRRPVPPPYNSSSSTKVVPIIVGYNSRARFTIRIYV